MNQLIHVVIPIYNVREHLERCIDSVLTQTHENICVWLVDDGSTDGSSQVCDEYARRDMRVQALHKENGGQASARNLALDQIERHWDAEKEFVTFVDSDDWVEPDYVEFLLDVLLTSGAEAAQCGHYITYSPTYEVQKNENHRLVELGTKDALESILRNGIWDITVWNKIFRASLFRDLRFPVGRYYEDTAIAPLLTERLNRVAVSMEPKYHYVQRYSSTANGTSWTDHKLDFVPIGDEVADHVLKLYPDLTKAALEKRVFVRLSTLSQMVNTGHLDVTRAKEIRAFICQHAWQVLLDKRASKRDKVGILMLLPGLGCYRVAWSLYYALRRRRAIGIKL